MTRDDERVANLFPHGEGMLVPVRKTDPDWLALPAPGYYGGTHAYYKCLGIVDEAGGEGPAHAAAGHWRHRPPLGRGEPSRQAGGHGVRHRLSSDQGKNKASPLAALEKLPPTAKADREVQETEFWSGRGVVVSFSDEPASTTKSTSPEPSRGRHG